MTRLVVVVLLASVACENPAGSLNGGVGEDDSPPGLGWLAVGAGGYNSCALDDNGRVLCWGFALNPTCGNASCNVDARPTPLPTTLRFARIASGGGAHCGVTSASVAYCWGRLASFVPGLGDGVTEQSAVPVQVAVPEAVDAVAVGYTHACVLGKSGAVYCWGEGLTGALGRGSSITSSALPRPVSSSLRFQSISAGTLLSCGVDVDAKAWCWGGGGSGVLGIGARDTSCAHSESCATAFAPIDVEGGHLWSSVSAGNGFTCGVTVGGSGYCWGDIKNRGDPTPTLGRLGSGRFEGSKVPVAVLGGHTFTRIDTGTRHACGVTLSSTTYCWGMNAGGELGTGRRTSPSALPQLVTGGVPFRDVDVGEVSCALSRNRNMYCWGLTAAGMLGNGVSSAGNVPRPTKIPVPQG